MVSVPTGDFSFIMAIDIPLDIIEKCFRPHRGLFFYHACWVSYIRFKERFRPHRGLFFYHIDDITLADMKFVSVPTGDFSFIMKDREHIHQFKAPFPSPPGTFLLSLN